MRQLLVGIVAQTSCLPRERGATPPVTGALQFPAESRLAKAAARNYIAAKVKESGITNPKIVAVIPAYNEALSIGKVVAEIPRPPVHEIIVVDNASTDRTAEFARNEGALVEYEAEPGYGAACLRGIAKAQQLNAELIVFMDGDHSDYGEEIPLLIKPILDDECDMVIGSRALGVVEKGALTPQQHYGNQLACFLMRVLLGAHYTDLGPFRAITMAALNKIDMRDRNYGWTVEMQIKAVKHKLRVREVPVHYRKRLGKSKVSGTVKGVVMAGYKIIFTILRHALTR
jgi:glycosyltransferase involved in cell wall biosynthesis